MLSPTIGACRDEAGRHEQAVHRCGEFVLVPSERLLLYRSQAVDITGKAFDTLAVLVRSQQAVGRIGRVARQDYRLIGPVRIEDIATLNFARLHGLDPPVAAEAEADAAALALRSTGFTPIARFRVVPRAAAFRFKGAAYDPLDAGR